MGVRRRTTPKPSISELEERDYYIEKNVFWVPALARWKTLQDSAKLPPGTEIEVNNGKKTTYKITSTGRLIDDALDAIGRENPKLNGVLNKTYTQLQLDPANLSSLIDLIATIPFEHADLHAKDILGHVYEYFLGQFALAEGKKGGQYFRPKSIVSLIVEMLEPYQGRAYDPAMGSGGFFACKQARQIRSAKPERASAPSGVQSQDKLARWPHRFAGQAFETIEPPPLAPSRDEHGHPRHRLQLRQGARQLFHQRPALRPARRLRDGEPAV